MKIVKTLYYDYETYKQYITIYQDLLGNFYFACINIGERGKKQYITQCLVSDVYNFERNYIICTTHYVDPAGNLRTVAPIL